MKLFFTALCSLSLSFFYAQTTIFQQNFNSSNTVSDYVGSPPSTNQFDFIGTTGSGVTTTINNGKLVMSKTGLNSGNFGRNTDFSPTPTLISISFKVNVTDNVSIETNAAYFNIGTNYNNNFGFIPNADTYALLTFSTTSVAGEYKINDITNSMSSPIYTGEVYVRWVLNNTGGDATYIDPNNNIATITNDKADIWVNNTLVFNDVNVETPTQNITDFKFLINRGPITITFDDFKIQEGNISLPIELTKLETKPAPNSIFINWQTASETNNDYFDIEHSLDAKVYKTVGQIKGQGTKQTASKYAYEHTTPSVGNNYYRLKQVDFDGRFTYSPIISVDFDRKKKGIVLKSNMTEGILQLDTNRDEPITYWITDITGRVVKTGNIVGNSTLDITALQANLYFLKFEMGEVFKVMKY
jgi:hypothetical protein